VLDRIRSEIAAHGPLPFDHFMALALYDPDGGYFAASTTLRSSQQGDFLTSPEVSPFFGATLARFVAAEAERLGPLALVEAGAGSGSLLRALLDELPEVPLATYAVEVAAAATERLRSSVPEAAVVGNLAEVPRVGAAVVVANELIDNLPAAVAVRRGSDWAEQVVDMNAATLVTREVPARLEVSGWADTFAGSVEEGDLVEVQIAAGEWITAALGLFDGGSIVVVDYGETVEGLRHRRAGGTMRTYRSHHLGPDPLLAPGETDITMDVNFTALAAAAESAGATVTLERQDGFLTRWGLRDVLTDVRNRELAAARTGETMERLALRSQVTGAEALLHPRGLGDFRVLVARK
jgi:SAM-dependent MidA family methyltransferase